jgi:hypothetical protein
VGPSYSSFREGIIRGFCVVKCCLHEISEVKNPQPQSSVTISQSRDRPKEMEYRYRENVVNYLHCGIVRRYMRDFSLMQANVEKIGYKKDWKKVSWTHISIGRHGCIREGLVRLIHRSIHDTLNCQTSANV